MKLRTVSRGIVAALVVVVGVIVLIHNRQAQSFAAPQLVGNDLGATVAPGFQLTDQTGAPVSLQQLRGHPAVVAFLYTHCPDQCPLMAEKLRLTTRQLGARATDVRWIAVSVDPVGDTPASAAAFIQTHQLSGLRYLLGARQQLAPVWAAYHIEVDAPTASGRVGHTGGLYVIDARGRERVYLDPSFDPKALASDLRALLAGA
ncbi:MAG: SCO family protein [Ktedonobacterales bacterium]|nr:SCO family protein [Ktedonobacterales bacterium]